MNFAADIQFSYRAAVPRYPAKPGYAGYRTNPGLHCASRSLD